MFVATFYASTLMGVILSMSCLSCTKAKQSEDIATDASTPFSGGSSPSPGAGLVAVMKSFACDVVVGGGSEAALIAALTSAREGVKTCLVEPTDWPGGQLTASAVSAIDFAWHKGAANYAHKKENIPTEFFAWLDAIGNPGGCWVSSNCFAPKQLLSNFIEPAIAKEKNLVVFRNSVIKSVQTQDVQGKKNIQSVTIVKRTPKKTTSNDGYDAFLSADIEDWYSPMESLRFAKEKFLLEAPNGKTLIVVDGTEFGEILVLSEANYLQGLDALENAGHASELCGQAFVFPFVISVSKSDVNEFVPASKEEHPEFYGWDTKRFSWQQLWTYRRILAAQNSNDTKVLPGDLSLQNWNPGNDYGYKYLFLEKDASAMQISDWKGGVNLQAIAEAERHSLGWYRYYKERAPLGIRAQLALDRSVLGTSHGLSKLPYVRDTRRSIGVDDFVLKTADFVATPKLGTRFPDAVGIGAYAIDVHGMSAEAGCSYPVGPNPELPPFYLPLRAHTNKTISNLLVTGKTMAQTFWANAATRLQPVEFSSGIAAGAIASYMKNNSIFSTTELLHGNQGVGKIENSQATGWWKQHVEALAANT